MTKGGDVALADVEPTRHVVEGAVLEHDHDGVFDPIKLAVHGFLLLGVLPGARQDSYESCVMTSEIGRWTRTITISRRRGSLLCYPGVARLRRMVEA